MTCDVFISYRRKDAAAHALCLKLAVERELGEQSVFLDTSSIGPGAEFPTDLRAALESAQVVLAVIGKQWLGSVDEQGRRRLDQEGDWVRGELETALRRGTHLIPVLVAEAALPSRDALPPSLAALADRNTVELREATLPADLRGLVLSLRQFFGISPAEPKGTAVFPVPPPHVPERLTAESLKKALSMIPAWTIEKGPLPGKPGAIRTELTRTFSFESFLGAVEFMQRTAGHIDQVDHHPRWENLWKTVTVWLTTWDIGHEISDRDITLARFLDHAYADRHVPRRRKS